MSDFNAQHLADPAGFCYWSFTVKEPHRYLAVIGGVLAILPANFY
jgi:hypothetical protein